MRFGFMLFTRDLRAAGDVSRLAEARGFDLIGIADSPALSYDPYMALTLAATATSRVRIGTAVTNVQTRHPLIVANLAASLEQLAPGRTFLGLGTGWSGVRHAGAGQTRLADLGEAVRNIRRLLAGETVELNGSAIALRVGACSVPILLATSGPKALRLAGEVADLALFNLGAVPEVLADGLGWIRDGALSAGRDSAAVEPWLFIPAAVAPNRQDALDAVSTAVVSSGAYVLRGDARAKRVPPELESRLAELCRGYQFGEHLATVRSSNVELAERLGLLDYLLDRFAVAGTPDDCIRKLTFLREAGVENVCLNLGSVEDVAANVDLFGREVLPAFAS